MKMKVCHYGNKTLAIEVLSAQNLFNANISEITIEGIGNLKHAMNNYDAEVTVNGITVILYRDLYFKNVELLGLLNADTSNIEFVDLKRENNKSLKDKISHLV